MPIHAAFAAGTVDAGLCGKTVTIYQRPRHREGKGRSLVIVQLVGQRKLELPRDSRVLATLRRLCFRPECGRHQGPIRRMIRDDAACFDHAISPAVVVTLPGARVFEKKPSAVGGCRDGRVPLGSAEGFDVGVVDGHAAPKQWMWLCLCRGIGFSQALEAIGVQGAKPFAHASRSDA